MTGMALAWMRDHQMFLQLLGILSLATFLITPLIVSYLIIRIPEDYFVGGRERVRELGRKRHPAIRLALAVARNAAGLVFLLAGIAMLVLPGQGVITILVGLTLVDFPGKHALEDWLVRRKRVLSALNWIRRKAHRPLLRV